MIESPAHFATLNDLLKKKKKKCFTRKFLTLLFGRKNNLYCTSECIKYIFRKKRVVKKIKQSKLTNWVDEISLFTYDRIILEFFS